MQKIITIAALLAAGTAFANAETWTIDSLVGPFGDGELDYQPLPATISGTDDWSISFDFSTDVLKATGNDWGMAVVSTSANAYKADFSDSFQVYLGGNGNLVMKVDGSTDTTVAKDGTISANTTYHFAFEFDSADASFTATVSKDGETLATHGWSNTSFADIALLSNNGEWLNKSYSAPANATYSNITLTGTAIPEPSAFGLLAGVGALALVASRRRRAK